MLYKIVDDLLYFDDDERDLRLCILTAIETEVFKLTHDEIGYPDYTRTHERLTEGLYIFNITTKLHEFIRYCFYCQLNQISRYKLYNFLQSILIFARLFHIFIIDFIFAFSKFLPLSNEYDYILLIIDKFFKAVIHLLGKII